MGWRSILEKDVVNLALTFDYGQRANEREQTHSALVNRSEDLPLLRLDELDDLKQAGQSAHQVWVPNRNGTCQSTVCTQ